VVPHFCFALNSTTYVAEIACMRKEQEGIMLREFCKGRLQKATIQMEISFSPMSFSLFSNYHWVIIH
jgi:hypothetical protein